MKICRFDDNRVGVIEGDTVRDVTSVTEDLPSLRWPLPFGDPFIAALPELRSRLEAEAKAAPSILVSEVRLLSPVANPGKIIGIGRIYKAHAEEAMSDPGIAHGHKVETDPDTIRMLLKANTALVGPSEGVPLRFLDRRNDHEMEFAIVIGRKGTDIPAERALEHVAGYCIGLDMSLRGPELPSSRKSIDGYAVLGPWLTTTDEISDPDSIGFSLGVNGEVRQRSNTSELAFDIRSIIENAASFYTLYPGDIVMTGTPEGVGPVHPGDIIEAQCDKVGRMTVEVRAHQPGELAR